MFASNYKTQSALLGDTGVLNSSKSTDEMHIYSNRIEGRVREGGRGMEMKREEGWVCEGEKGPGGQTKGNTH